MAQQDKIKRLLIEKAKRQLTAILEDGTKYIFRIALGSNPVGNKEKSGDGRTPEGSFHICYLNYHSSNFKSAALDYPTLPEMQKRASAGDPPICIHGHRPDVPPPDGDWTDGCIALSNTDMETLFSILETADRQASSRDPNDVWVEVEILP